MDIGIFGSVLTTMIIEAFGVVRYETSTRNRVY